MICDSPKIAKWHIAVLFLVASFSGNLLSAELSPEMRANMMPYADGLPTHPFAKPGVHIDASNVDQAKDVLVPMLYKMIKDGWVEIDVTETTPVSQNPKYVETTAKNVAGSITFDEDTVNIVGYEAGRPFPYDPDVNDPLAGLKMLWNYRYFQTEGDTQYVHMSWLYKNMKNARVERELKLEVHLRRLIGRVSIEPLPNVPVNPSQINNSFYMRIFEPFDLSNTQLLIHTYQDDNRRPDAWLYLGFQRRVRRLATGQVTDAFLGTDLMIEDFRGYNTRISEYEWKFIETKYILSPVYHRKDVLAWDESLWNFRGVVKEGSHGRGNCYPAVPYQLRKVYVVDGKPRDSSHPLSSRYNYLDVETATFIYSEVYDNKGAPWKLFTIPYSHPDTSPYPSNHGTGGMNWSQPSQIDIQVEHCTTLHFNTITNDPELEDPNVFNVQHLRKTGR